MNTFERVDHTAIRISQASVIVLLLAGFILNTPWAAAAVALFMLSGSLVLRRPGFFWLYAYILRPLGVARPDWIEDYQAPHIFAQGFGGVVVLGSTIALLAGAAGLGWGLSWLVIGLAALNLFGGFCAGCFVYYWLNRLGVPGFVQAPPAGTLPGFRPSSQGARHVGK